jgi:hypothetical protein
MIVDACARLLPDSGLLTDLRSIAGRSKAPYAPEW